VWTQIDRETNRRQKILVVDDSEMNRSILADMLDDEYDIIEAENGKQAVSILQQHREEFSLVLLDIVMPQLDGFGVLNIMNENGWIEEVPVIMISAESSSTHVERAYQLGVTDFIGRPFDALIVHHRVVNTLFLYNKQRKLANLVAEQIYEKEKRSNLMIDVLSHIVEFRNGESGQHVRNVHILTELLLEQLVKKTDRYQLSWEDISLISTASALHDIGKIAIDEKILNKPGRLTPEEFAVMKTHSIIGAQMLEELPVYKEEQLVKVAYEICRWHHERYDGRGYPDGLRGDEIPISAQVVALADVYDALTSERVYKKAVPHEQAIQMIVNGECGAFHPQMLECLADVADDIQRNVQGNDYTRMDRKERQSVAKEMQRYRELTASERTLQLLEHERMKYSFFAELTKEIQFEYSISPPMVTLSNWGAERLGLDEIVMDPLHDKKALSLMATEDWRRFLDKMEATTPRQPTITYDCRLLCGDEWRWFQIIARSTWNSEEPPQRLGTIGKATDIHDSRMKLDSLERMATHDSLTGLLNHASAKKLIEERILQRPESQYAMVIFDLDWFKKANDNYGHLFGDQLLIHMAEKLRHCIRESDIAIRVGGDEFAIFLEYKMDLEPVIQRIYRSLCGKFQDFTISISMGIARADVVGTDYESMFHAADQALYYCKRSGRGQYHFYNSTMEDMLSAISQIEENNDDRYGDAKPVAGQNPERKDEQ
jgi:diguanylate cyclase (GGDEF)-like protein